MQRQLPKIKLATLWQIKTKQNILYVNKISAYESKLIIAIDTVNRHARKIQKFPPSYTHISTHNE